MFSTPASSKARPAICRPTGSPPANPQGTVAAGRPFELKSRVIRERTIREGNSWPPSVTTGASYEGAVTGQVGVMRKSTRSITFATSRFSEARSWLASE